MDATRYYLMRKNEVITLLQLNNAGDIVAFSKNMTERAKEIAPIAYKSDPGKWIYQWWKERSIPITRDHIKDYLTLKGYTAPQYLVKNLGLSLTDYYWIKPVDSNLNWDNINLYENDFHDNTLLSSKEPDNEGVPHYSPNGSLQGNIEKTWTIIDNDRCLVKGNHSVMSRESFNEVIASEMHRLQGYDNFTSYSLIHIKGKPYKYGCYSKAFTSSSKELISAWTVCTSVRRESNVSYFEHFINVCKSNGVDSEQLRRDLEYQIMSDFILTGYDRHLNNISILRDADTLKYIRMAPIYDSGDCLFANRELPQNMHELQKMEISSFAKNEPKQLKLVKDPLVIDLTKLPPVSYIKSVYEKDDNISNVFTNRICEWYEKKIDICRSIQLGKDVYHASFNVSSPSSVMPISQKMENVWHQYFELPKSERDGIYWEGKKLRPAIFDDMYLSQCKIDNRIPDKRISDHFWKNCVEKQEYVPHFCQPDNANRS